MNGFFLSALLAVPMQWGMGAVGSGFALSAKEETMKNHRLTTDDRAVSLNQTLTLFSVLFKEFGALPKRANGFHVLVATLTAVLAASNIK